MKLTVTRLTFGEFYTASWLDDRRTIATSGSLESPSWSPCRTRASMAVSTGAVLVDGPATGFPGPGAPQIHVMALTALLNPLFHASGIGMYPLSAKPFWPAPMVLCRNAFTAVPTCESGYFEQ